MDGQASSGLEWVTVGISVLALAVSIVAALLNRHANRMRELSEQARFHAAWEPAGQDDRTALVLENTGDAGADRLVAAFSDDPNRILGLTGFVVDRIRPNESAVFEVNATQDQVTMGIWERAPRILLTWYDQWGTPRHQSIPYRDVRFREPDAERTPRHVASTAFDGPDLFDPSSFRLFTRRPWKLRRDKTPAGNWDLPNR